MDPFSEKKSIRKHKKWLSEEIKCILDYLEQEKDIELPTAQSYYNKLISQTGINANWNLIKWKVRHLKTNYKKAKDWCCSNKGSLLDEDWYSDSIEAEILRICPQFYQLDRIFGKNYQAQTSFETVDMADEISEAFSIVEKTESNSSFPLNAAEDGSDSQNFDSIDSAIKVSDDYQPKILISEGSEEKFSEKNKNFKRKSTSSHMSGLQAHRSPFYKMKLDWEKQKHAEEIKLDMKRLDLEEKKIKADIEFKKKLLELKAREIVRDEKLKILEMEKDERLKRYEIDMKYKNTDNNEPTI